MRGLEKIYSSLSIINPSMILREINDRSYSSSYSLLQGLIESGENAATKDILPAITKTADVDSILWQGAAVITPVFINIPEGRMLLEMVFDGYVGLDKTDSSFKGIRLNTLKELEIIDPNIEVENINPLLIVSPVEAVEYNYGEFNVVKSPLENIIKYTLYDA